MARENFGNRQETLLAEDREKSRFLRRMLLCPLVVALWFGTWPELNAMKNPPIRGGLAVPDGSVPPENNGLLRGTARKSVIGRLIRFRCP
jgi:hypothetical protein